ncbi:MAG: taurine dioxygenase [Alphaproteobacteria bacterium]|nr:MAG: taurine dioxygenase [Alphaproteobacteria bacterium]
MTCRHIEIRPLTPALGAEISGPEGRQLDLSQPLDAAVFADIERAFHEYAVLVFRDQRLDPAALAAFAGRFGPLGRYPFAAPLPGHPHVVPIIKEAHQTTNFGGMWHSDTAYLERPPLGSALYALEVPPLGGDTLFANMVLAYESLSSGMQALLDGLKAINSAAKNGGTVRAAPLAEGTMVGRDLDKMATHEAVHPVVRTHPVTGRKALYVNRAHTVRFEAMSEAESAPILEFLFAHAVREEFTCRVRWAPGTLALWDNRCTQHYPLNDYHGHRRVMHRVTIEGERPV